MPGDPPVADLDSKKLTQSEFIQRAFPKAHVVKAFNVILFSEIADGKPKGSPKRRALPIASDNKPALDWVAKFHDDVGFDVIAFEHLKDGAKYDAFHFPWQRTFTLETLKNYFAKQ